MPEILLFSSFPFPVMRSIGGVTTSSPPPLTTWQLHSDGEITYFIIVLQVTALETLALCLEAELDPLYYVDLGQI